MSKEIRWQVRFSTADVNNPTLYRVDIYDEQDGSWSGITQVTAGATPFMTNEDSSDDFFYPVRSQTGTLQVCTRLPNGGTLNPDDIRPANNIERPIILNRINSNDEVQAVEWQGFLSCEAYSQNYTSVPENIDIPVISVLEAMRTAELSFNMFGQTGSETVGDFIADMLRQVYEEMFLQVSAVYSQASSDILSKYIFVSQFFSYDTSESSETISYVYKGAPLYDILTEICKFMGWVCREQGETLYFIRNWSDEIGTTSANISSLELRDKDHKRSIRQGAKSVSVVANVSDFETHFDMPTCPHTGLTEKIQYVISNWYYDKCTQANVGKFTSEDVTKCFLCRFYGIVNNSVFPWNTIYEDIGFRNALYLIGQKYEDSSYVKRCTIKSIEDFSVICGVANTEEDVGYFTLEIKEETSSNISNGYIRCGLKFIGRYYSGITGMMWATQPATFKIGLTNGKAKIEIPIPKISNVYTFATSDIELYIYDDFDINSRTSAVISDISLKYTPPFKKDSDNSKTNKYIRNLGDSRDEIKIDLKLASSYGNANGLSHIYGVTEYTYGQDSIDYLEPITSLDYVVSGETEARRPEVDLLDRMAEYYCIARQTLILIVKHPIAAPLPLLKLNGINDGKVYLPLAEARDWKQDTSTLTCFEMPQTPSQS